MFFPEAAVLSKQPCLRVSHCKYININKQIKPSPLSLLIMILLVHQNPWIYSDEQNFKQLSCNFYQWDLIV